MFAPPGQLDDPQALIEEARRRARRRRLALLGAVLTLGGLAFGIWSSLGHTARGTIPAPLGRRAPLASRSSASTIVPPFSYGYVREGLPGAVRGHDGIAIASTYAQALRWDRFFTHHRVTPPQSADFSRRVLVGIFLFGHPARKTQGTAVTSMKLTGGTLSLTLETSPWPIATCYASPDAGNECRPMYRAPWGRYHAFTVVGVGKGLAARIQRIAVTQETRDARPIEVWVPVSPVP